MEPLETPHKKSRGVRIFLFEIFTITVGLFIALALNDFVEWQQHRSLVRAAESSLRTEIGGDLKAGHLARHLDELGVPGDRAVLIGDSLDDALAAESVGAAAVLYTGGFTHPARLRASGRPVADTLVEAVRVARSL